MGAAGPAAPARANWGALHRALVFSGLWPAAGLRTKGTLIFGMRASVGRGFQLQSAGVQSVRLQSGRARLAALLVGVVLLATGCGLTAGAVASVGGSMVSEAWISHAVDLLAADPDLAALAGVARPSQETQGEYELDPPERMRRIILNQEVIAQMFEGEVFKLGGSLEPASVYFWNAIDNALMTAGRPGLGERNQEAVEIVIHWRAAPRALRDALTPQQPDERVLTEIYDRYPILRYKICMSVMLLPTREKVDEARRRIIEGQEGFGAVAADMSEDPRTGQTRGDMGCVVVTDQGVDPAAFDLASQTEPGKMSGPVESSVTGGFWLVRVASREGDTFETAVPQLIEQYRPARDAIFEQTAPELLERTDVRLVADAGRWDSQTGAVLPSLAELEASAGGESALPFG